MSKAARWGGWLLAAAVVLVGAALGSAWVIGREGRADLSHGRVPVTLAVGSTSFANGAPIPKLFSCDGANLSPDISWPAPPPGTKSFAIVMDDLDAPLGFTHWLVYDLAPSVRGIAQGASPGGQLPPGAVEGRNDFGGDRYGGPCPPRGQHRYRFSLYAIGIALDLPRGATKQALANAVAGHIVARGQIVGIYRRAN